MTLIKQQLQRLRLISFWRAQNRGRARTKLRLEMLMVSCPMLTELPTLKSH